MRLLDRYLIMASVLFVSSVGAFAASDSKTRLVQFAKDTSSSTLKGSIKGYESIDYKLSAKSGQTMHIKLNTSNLSSYFNVLPPGSNDEAIFIGSINGNEWSATLETDGLYTIRVYLMRNAARRNETANYTLSVSIAGSGSGDAKVKDTPYHATGQVPCSMGSLPQGSQQCTFGVIRGKMGYAEVYVTPLGGFKRVLIFDGNKVGSDTDAKVKAQEDGDLWSVDVNDYEHYQIPKAVILGG